MQGTGWIMLGLGVPIKGTARGIPRAERAVFPALALPPARLLGSARHLARGRDCRVTSDARLAPKQRYPHSREFHAKPPLGCNSP